MRPRTDLPTLERWARQRVHRLRRQVNGLRSPSNSGNRPLVAWSIIELHASWATFCRLYFLSSASQARTRTGRVTSSLTGLYQIDPLTFAVHQERRHLRHSNGPWSSRDEPTWHDVNVFLRLLAKAGCSNALDVATAISLGSSTLQDLTTYRNFAAHKNVDTALKVRRMQFSSYSIPRQIDPLDFPLVVAVGRSQSIVEDWLDDVDTIVSLLPD